ncbi:MAG TPA: response regulator [Candidatus Binataceae bacterium]|nr:response regulator [Candidatus Binataceae bacterium]
MSDAGARVLVVDDNDGTLYSTSRVLRAAGFEVAEGASGEEALDLALKDIDLMLLDVNLPDLHGFEVCRRLRQDPRTARLPIIHVSATFVTDLDKAHGLDSGADGYLTHPIEPSVLIATIKAFLRARRAEEEMHRSEAKFRTVFENAFVGIVLLDERLNYLQVNPAMCGVLDRKREEIVGFPLLSFIAPGGPRDSLEIERSLEETGIWRGTFAMARPDGQLIHLEWHISAESFPGVRLAVVTDISDRMRFESERNDLLASERSARAEAERANNLKDEFLSTLSHELRTPLNSILLWTQRLQHDFEDRSQIERGLSAIERNTKVQAQLISDLLDVSAIVSGKLRLEIRPLDLVATINNSLEGLTPAIDAKQLKLQSWFDVNAGLISGDAQRLQQVVWNLVNNAIKFTPSGGHIELRLERVESHVEISVADNGQGVRPELLPYLFDRFRQGDVTSNRSHGGLGLGLAIVKHLIEMHGGNVSASSAGLGQGAKFTVTLPVAPTFRDSINADSPGTPEFARLEGVRILVVDDDTDTCAVLSRILEETGAVVATAFNVESALGQFERSTPQVLISDIGMPDLDGYALIREVRARGHSYQVLPAIALTALARPEDRRRALLAGYQMHMAKPIDASELTTAIAALLGRTEPRD